MLAVDIPSGVDALTGVVAGQVLAAYTGFEEKAKTVDSASYRLEDDGVLHRPGAVEAGVVSFIAVLSSAKSVLA